MGNSLGLLGRQLGEIWHHFGVNQKVNTILALFIVIGVIGGLLYWSSIPSYRLLYSGLTMEDAAAAQEKLSDEKVPVQLKDSGTSIYVPAGDVYRCRLLLVADGIPKNATTGFELFEQPKLGLTDFAQKVNYQRALQGELERTISAMEGITSAKVLLVLPKDKVFASESDKKATASIMLNVVGGTVLTPLHVRSIKQLVGSSVPGLSANSIAITDQYGRMLAKGSSDSDAGIEAANEQLEAQAKLEELLAAKAQAMLDMAFGIGKSIVRVSALMDFSQIEKRDEKLDAENRVVISENIMSENTSTPGMSSGGPASVNVGDGKVSMDQSLSTTKKEDINTEYKVPSGYEHKIEKGARITSLSVSVCVAKGETARTPEQLKSLENMVKSAVGIVDGSLTRKDTIQVVEMEFPVPEPMAKASFLQSMPVSLTSIGNGVAAIVLLIVIMIGSRKIINNLSVQRAEVGMPVGMLAGAGGGAGGGMVPPGAGAGLEANLDTVTRLAEQNPNAVAAWITSVSNATR